MSEVLSALNGRTAEGFVRVAEMGLVGMVTIRADLGGKALARALRAEGLPLPAARRIETAGARAVAWMSPDELLVICPHAEAPGLVARLDAALAGDFALIVDVSDARAVFSVAGAQADQVLMKLCPADMASLPQGEMRRSRVAQVAAAFWRAGPEEIRLICFRSVAAYVFGLLEVSARPGSELF